MLKITAGPTESAAPERLSGEGAAQHYAAIVESSADAILSKDLNGVIMSWNKGAELLFGYTAEEAVGKPVTILIPVERHDEEPRILERVRRGENIDHYETIRQRKDGSLIDISLTVSPIKNEKGEIVAASKIARDITESKRACRAAAAPTSGDGSSRQEFVRVIDQRFEFERLLREQPPTPCGVRGRPPLSPCASACSNAFARSRCCATINNSDDAAFLSSRRLSSLTEAREKSPAFDRWLRY